MIIDATNLILGRLASFIAKQSLKGEQIEIINSEKVVIVGKKDDILSHYQQKLERGHPYAGPFFQRREDRLLKKTIVGMLPHKQEKGRLASKRIKCYINIPIQFQNKKSVSLDKINVANTKNVKYMTLQELCKLLGRKE